MRGNFSGNRHEFSQGELELLEPAEPSEPRRETDTRNCGLEVIESLEYLNLHSDEKKRHDRLEVEWHSHGIFLGSHHELRTCVPGSLENAIEFA